MTAILLARGKTLVIAPKTQCEDQNWPREWEGLAKHIRLLSEITVISKETFRRDHKKLPRFDTVIVDEAHTALGATPGTRWLNRVTVPKTSQIFEALEEYLARTDPERIYLCTATIVRSPMTVWAAAKVLGRKWDFLEFREAFYVKLPMPGREVWSPRTSDDVKDRLARAVRGLGYVGRLEDFFDVPEQTFKDVYVPLTEEQQKRIKALPLEYPEPIVLLGKKLQVENGILSGDEFNDAEVFDNAKIDALCEYAIEFPKMIVFARYIEQIRQIEKALRKQGKTVFVMTGDTKDRGELLAKVNATDDYAFIVSAQISAGWEVPDCPVMIFASRTYSLVDQEQSWGRILRANALKKNLYINLIVKGGIDEAVHKTLLNKQDFSERVYLNL